MKNIKSIGTTLVGLGIIASTLYFVYKGKTTFTEAGGFITIGIALLFSDDEKFAQNFLPFLYKNKTTASVTPTDTKDLTDINEPIV